MVKFKRVFLLEYEELYGSLTIKRSLSLLPILPTIYKSEFEDKSYEQNNKGPLFLYFTEVDLLDITVS